MTTVYVVDDDPSVLKSMRWLIESGRFSVKTFASGMDFMEAYDPTCPGCLVLDMRMPGMNGLEVQRRLVEQGIELPVIIMTGYGDVPVCTQAFNLGAFDFMEKPADGQILLDRLRQAIALDAERVRHRTQLTDFAERRKKLSSREAEVLVAIVNGKTMKEIALGLGIAIQTVAKHRARVLEKLKVKNDVELAQLSSHLVSSLEPPKFLGRRNSRLSAPK